MVTVEPDTTASDEELALFRDAIRVFAEEQLRPIGFVMSHAAAAAIDYDGERPEGFQESDD